MSAGMFNTLGTLEVIKGVLGGHDQEVGLETEGGSETALNSHSLLTKRNCGV